MKIGTRSLLFGVHQFLWHPFTVVLAWRKLYGRWPKWTELVAIALHDVGYWGCPNIDGKEGRRHPVRGAILTFKTVLKIAKAIWWFRNVRRTRCGLFPRRRLTKSGMMFFSINRSLECYFLALLHSRELARSLKFDPSALCWADKLSIAYEPAWFYLLRARLSGELAEFKGNSPIPNQTNRQWFDWYRGKVASLIRDVPPELIDKTHRAL